MAITFRYNAAAVVPPSNESTRKYGQNLVLQQQQQKYQEQQAGYDRMFQLGKDNLQNQFQLGRDNQLNQFQVGRDKARNEFQVGRDKVQFEQQQQQQRAQDFSAARARIDSYAKEALSDPDLPQELRQKIQNLIAGKMTALGGGFNGPAQQEFLDQYNASLAAILSEIPPPKPKPAPQEQFVQGIVTDPVTGMRYRPKGDYEPLPQQESSQQPKDAQGYYSENEEQFQKDLDATMKAMQNAVDAGDSQEKVTPEKAWEKMQEAYQFRQQALGRGLSAQPQPGPQSTAPAPQSGQLPPGAEQIPGMASAWFGGATNQQPAGPAIQENASTGQSNAWAEVVAPQSAPMPLTANSSSRNPAGEVPMRANRSEQGVPAPNFGELVASAQDDEDRAVLGGLQGIYASQPPEIQNLIGVLVSPNAKPKEKAMAAAALRDAGIDLEQLTAASKKKSDMVYPSTGLM
jgi:hypothetical protein